MEKKDLKIVINMSAGTYKMFEGNSKEESGILKLVPAVVTGVIHRKKVVRWLMNKYGSGAYLSFSFDGPDFSRKIRAIVRRDVLENIGWKFSSQEYPLVEFCADEKGNYSLSGLAKDLETYAGFKPIEDPYRVKRDLEKLYDQGLLVNYVKNDF